MKTMIYNPFPLDYPRFDLFEVGGNRNVAEYGKYLLRSGKYAQNKRKRKTQKQR